MAGFSCDANGTCDHIDQIITLTANAQEGLPLSADFLFQLQYLSIISWITLILNPFAKLSDYLLLGPPILLCLSYTAMFVHNFVSHVFSIASFMEMTRDRYFVAAVSNHFWICDLWVGYWMARDFWSHYLAGYSPTKSTKWTKGRLIFTAILALTMYAAPMGFLVYHIAKWTIWAKSRTAHAINVRNTINEEEVLEKFHPLLDYRWAHIGDDWSPGARRLYRGIAKIVGLFSLFFIMLPSQFLLAVYCNFTFKYGHLPDVWQYNVGDNNVDYFQFQKWFLIPLNWIKVPFLLRRFVYAYRFQTTVLRYERLIIKDKKDWSLMDRYVWFYLLQSYTLLEYGAVFAEDPFPLFNSIQIFWTAKSKFENLPPNISFFPYGDGIGVSTHDYVVRYLHQKKPGDDIRTGPKKAKEIIGWKVSSTQANFCPTASLYLSTDDPRLTIGRDLIKTWIHGFTHPDVMRNDKVIRWKTIPRVANPKLVDRDTIYMAIGEAMFYCITGGGQFSKQERAAYLDCVLNSKSFLPSWFNFFLAGDAGRIQSYDGMLLHRKALARYPNAKGWTAALENRNRRVKLIKEKIDRGERLSPEDEATKIFTEQEMLRLFTFVFNIAAGVAPAKLCVAVVNRLWTKGTEERRRINLLFRQHPREFIRESARLDKLVPMVNIASTDGIRDEIRKAMGIPSELPSDTMVHCSLVSANHDPAVFSENGRNQDDFDPLRDANVLDEIVAWSSRDGDQSWAPRICPGRNFAIDIVQFVAERFAPVMEDAPSEMGMPSESDATSEDVVSGKHEITHAAMEDRIPEEFLVMRRRAKSAATAAKPAALVPENPELLGIRDANLAGKVLADAANTFEEHDKQLVKGLDPYTKFVMGLKDVAIKEWNIMPPRGLDMASPLDRPMKELSFFLPECAPNEIPGWDEDQPEGSSIKRQIARKLVNADLWSIVDLPRQFQDRQEAITYRWNIFGALPPPNVVFDELKSDKAMSRLAFFGLAAHRTKRTSNVHGIPDRSLLTEICYVNDATALSSFKVRAGFEQYGAAAYFDKDYEIIGIYWSHAERMILKPATSTPEWEHAKWVWKSSFFAEVTIVDHLLVTHMIEANALVSASRHFLSSDHPLRIFLKPFTYHTVSINQQAITSLMNQRGLVHRSWAFDYHEFMEVCKYVSLSYQFTLLPDKLHESMRWSNRSEWNGTPLSQSLNDIPTKKKSKEYEDVSVAFEKDPRDDDVRKHYIPKEEWDRCFPIDRDLAAFWNIVHGYVERFMNDNFPESTLKGRIEDKLPGHETQQGAELQLFISDICKQLGISAITSRRAFIDVLTHLICVGTGWHEHVGQVSDYMIDPEFVGLKMEQGLERQTVQTYSQVLSLTVVTGLEMPGILEDWSHLFDVGNPSDPIYQKNLSNYIQFKTELHKLSEEIDELNKIRRFPFQSFNPKNMETSVSV
eukprot:TRINITY_DN759_c0_g1_i1.p1 TRINITY_DN759_c0_g1~~TRINITY_DN759_c0_g1_i1.p1  ORF type:complete len:1432 (-),score=425.71 TRINITY_DN759_c0_g1_i1:53-4348(-)